MKNYLSSLLFLILLLATAGCNTTLFLPQTQNVPLFTHEKQLQASTSIGARTIDFQAAYSPVNHLGVITNLQIAPRHRMIEIGVGMFQSYGDHIVTELYAGYGNGYLKADYDHKTNPLSYDYDHYNIDINANKFFLQPNFGIKFTEKINLSFSTKFVLWDYSHYQYYHEEWIYSDGSSFLSSTDSLYTKHGSSLTIEPAVTFRVGGSHTKFMMQAGLCPVLASGGIDFAL